ncbi:DnaJ domain-containing protein [Bisporella sp. PMI_857]|nr:DnaJ domain-containing protein [Bisporella sp. PMI_857]
MNSQESHYVVLGVARTATEVEIRKAYRKLAITWHPDKNKAPNAAAQFRRVQEAYELLSDEERRRNYDAKLDLLAAVAEQRAAAARQKAAGQTPRTPAKPSNAPHPAFSGSRADVPDNSNDSANRPTPSKASYFSPGKFAFWKTDESSSDKNQAKNGSPSAKSGATGKGKEKEHHPSHGFKKSASTFFGTRSKSTAEQEREAKEQEARAMQEEWEEKVREQERKAADARQRQYEEGGREERAKAEKEQRKEAQYQEHQMRNGGSANAGASLSEEEDSDLPLAAKLVKLEKMIRTWKRDAKIEQAKLRDIQANDPYTARFRDQIRSYERDIIEYTARIPQAAIQRDRIIAEELAKLGGKYPRDPRGRMTPAEFHKYRVLSHNLDARCFNEETIMLPERNERYRNHIQDLEDDIRNRRAEFENAASDDCRKVARQAIRILETAEKWDLLAALGRMIIPLLAEYLSRMSISESLTICGRHSLRSLLPLMMFVVIRIGLRLNLLGRRARSVVWIWIFFFSPIAIERRCLVGLRGAGHLRSIAGCGDDCGAWNTWLWGVYNRPWK